MTLLRDKFITGYAEETYHPKTIKSYIMSVRHFFTYVISGEAPEIMVDKAVAISSRERLQRWSASYKKECNKHQWEKREQDLQRIVTPALVEKFEKSEAARDAIVLLGHLASAKNIEVTQRRYTLVRDFLMAEISIDNANRAGVLSNMTVREYQTAKLTNDDCYVVKVMNHKTVASKGPANVVLSKKLYGWMDIYLKKLRSALSDYNCCQFFLSWNGKNLESSQIGKALKSVFKKANIEILISSNDFRKGAVTEVHDNHKNYNSSLAILLDHDESTANRYYRLCEKTQASVRASKQLAFAMRNSGKNDLVTEENTEVQLPSEKETAEQRIDRMFTPSSSVISPTVYSCNSAGIFSREYVDILLNVCADMLVSHPISKPVIVERLQNSDDGKKLLGRVSVEQIINRLKYERRLKKRST